MGRRLQRLAVGLVGGFLYLTGLHLNPKRKKNKLRKKKRKALEAAARGAEKDAQVLERYRQRYLKKLEKEQLKKKKGNSPN